MLSLNDGSTRKQFRRWLTGHGSTVFPPTNDYEVLRFQTPVGTGVVYKNKSGLVSSMTGGAEEAWEAFCANRPWTGTPKTRRETKSAARRRGLVESLAARDGWACMYCGKALSVENATIEHIVPLSGGGRDSIFNMSLACRACNHAVGNMDVRQKIHFAIQIQKKKDKQDV